MSTRTTATHTSLSAARCFTVATVCAVSLSLMGCDSGSSALRNKADAGKPSSPDAGGKDVANRDTSGNTGGSSTSGGTSGTGGKSGTGGSTSVPGNACTTAGGTCVAVFPGSCSGTISALSCGSGIGTECCMSGGPGGSGGSSGVGGTPGAGGKSGAGGSTSVPGNACTTAGGTCVAVYPGSCSGTISALSCGSGIGTECCMSGGGRGGNSGQGGRAAGGTTGQGGQGGQGPEPPAAACEKLGGVCMDQGACARQGGTLAAESPAGCQFSGASGECCIPPSPKPNPTTCAEAGGVCTSITGCGMAGGYFTSTNYECIFPDACCVPNASCGTATIECCAGAVVYNPACQGGQFACVIGSPVPKGTCLR